MVVLQTNEEASRAKLLSIQSLLKVPTLPEEHHDIIEGTCRWIDDLADFKEWRDSIPSFEKDEKYSPWVYWVYASPGSGKTILASYVQSQLRELNLQHATHYFRYGNKTTQSLAVLLRSIAYEMAKSSAAVRNNLGELCNHGSLFDLDDARAIWSVVFKGGIFQVPLHAPQYWVIDALDECVKYSELFSLLKGIQVRFPLRIFFTSRKLHDSSKVYRQMEGCIVTTIDLPAKNTTSDIELLIRKKVDDLPIYVADEKEKLTSEILAKTGTSFLWARLVPDELDGVFGHEGMQEVLREIPRGMMSYYQRIINEMGQKKRETHIAKAILQWVVLAARPLTITELTDAIKLDIGASLTSPKLAIEGLCGQLLVIDAESEQVHIVHATAREFLLSEDAGEFRIHRLANHSRIALTCLRLLIGPEMRPPRHPRLLELKRSQRPHSPMLDYAISHFSEHVFSASADNGEIIAALDSFFSKTVLAWVEKLAIADDLRHLIRTARDLKGYIDRRLGYCSPLDHHVRCVDKWAIDLSRLATKFGSALRVCPHSIYFLIPPLCPTETRIYKQFGRTELTVLALKNRHWDDCIATVNFEDDITAAVSCGGNLIALGFESGALHLYNQRSYQKERSIHVNFAMDLIRIDSEGLFIATSVGRQIVVWDLHGNLRWKAKSRSKSILLTSSATFVINITDQGHMIKRDAETGEIVEEQTYTYHSPDLGNEATSQQVKTPIHATISTDFELLALAYRNGSVCIFDLQSQELIGWAIDENSRAASHVLFNPIPETYLLLVAYDDAHLTIYDSCSGALLNENEPEGHVIYNSVASSPDGRTFATVDARGILRIWDFAFLVELYHVVTPSHSFRMLEFTSDSLCLLDTVDQELRVWSPSVLIRKTEDEESSISDQTMSVQGQYDMLNSSRVDTFCVHETLPLVFCGTHRGEVLTYDGKTGKQSDALYSHREGVRYISASKTQLIASSDLNSLVKVWEFNYSESGIRPSKLLFENRSAPPPGQLGSAVCQLLFDESGEHILVTTKAIVSVYNIKTSTLIGSMSIEAMGENVWKWMSLPKLQDGTQVFGLIQDHTLRLFACSDFPSIISGIGVLPLDYSTTDGYVETDINLAVFAAETKQLIVEVQQTCGYNSRSVVFIFQLLNLETSSPIIHLLGTLPPAFCTHFLGTIIRGRKPKLVFLDHGGWVASIDAAMLMADKQYVRHFFVPGT